MAGNKNSGRPANRAQEVKIRNLRNSMLDFAEMLMRAGTHEEKKDLVMRLLPGMLPKPDLDPGVQQAQPILAIQNAIILIASNLHDLPQPADVGTGKNAIPRRIRGAVQSVTGPKRDL